MTKEERKVARERWETFSPAARKVVKTLKDIGFLKLPDHMRGWGLASYLLNMVATEVDEVLKGK